MTIAVLLFLFLVPLAIDIYSHREHKELSIRAAAIWSGVYIGAALLFAAYLFAAESADKAGLFTAGYILEKTLSVDNLMVFGVIFRYFGIAPKHRHSVLHWGIIGSVVLRLTLVGIGVGAISFMGRITEAVFGILVLASIKGLLIEGDDKVTDYDSTWYVNLLKHFIPVVHGKDVDGLFFSRSVIGARWKEGGHEFYDLANCVVRWCITPLFICLVTIELSDVGFAFDSVPTVIAVTREPVLVYAAIMFAVLGLRSLYFLLEAITAYMAHMTKAVAVVLAFVGVKLLSHAAVGWDVDPTISVFVILGILFIGVIASLIFPPKEEVPVVE